MSVRIRYACPHCNRRILHHPELAGQLVICSVCKGEFYEPTDPLPGKPAERALQAMGDGPRRLRVPEGNNPKHDLAILSRSGADDQRTITEIVEAVLLDDNPPPPSPPKPSASRADETINDFGYVSQAEDDRPAIPSWQPPSRPSALGTPASPVQPAMGVPTLPAAPAAPVSTNPAARAPQNVSATSATPSSLAGPAMRPLVPPSAVIPTAIVATPQVSRSIPKPAVPVPSANKPIPAPGLAGVSIKQMVEELRRRGLGVALVTADMAPMRNFELAFSDNMTRDDALVLLRKYLDTLREAKPAEQSGLLKRMWKSGTPE